MRVSHSTQVNSKHEVESLLQKFMPELKQSFLIRILAFTLSGTVIVDLKDEHKTTDSVNLALKLKSDNLTSFLCQLIFQKRKSEDKPRDTENICLSETFQESINIQMMNHSVSNRRR